MKLFYEYHYYNGKEYLPTRGWINPEKVVCIEEIDFPNVAATKIVLDNGERRLFAQSIEEVFRLIFNIGPANAENPEAVAHDRLKKWIDAQKAKNKR